MKIVAIPYTFGSSRLFSSAIAWEHGFIISSLENYIVRRNLLSIVGKTTDTKVPILPSRTRQGSTLNTVVALDSPSVINKLVIPPHASRAITA